MPGQCEQHELALVERSRVKKCELICTAAPRRTGTPGCDAGRRRRRASGTRRSRGRCAGRCRTGTCRCSAISAGSRGDEIVVEVGAVVLDDAVRAGRRRAAAGNRARRSPRRRRACPRRRGWPSRADRVRREIARGAGEDVEHAARREHAGRARASAPRCPTPAAPRSSCPRANAYVGFLRHGRAVVGQSRR